MLFQTAARRAACAFAPAGALLVALSTAFAPAADAPHGWAKTPAPQRSVDRLATGSSTAHSPRPRAWHLSKARRGRTQG